MAATLLNPMIDASDPRAQTFLGYTYVCGVDGQTYSAGGRCPEHPSQVLERLEIDP